MKQNTRHCPVGADASKESTVPERIDATNTATDGGDADGNVLDEFTSKFNQKNNIAPSTK